MSPLSASTWFCELPIVYMFKCKLYWSLGVLQVDNKQDEKNLQELNATLPSLKCNHCVCSETRRTVLERIRPIQVNSCHQIKEKQMTLNKSERKTVKAWMLQN